MVLPELGLGGSVVVELLLGVPLPVDPVPVLPFPVGPTVVVPLISVRKQGVSKTLKVARETQTLRESWKTVICLHVRLRLVQSDSDGDKGEHSLKLGIELDGLRHGEVIQLVRQHDRANL